MDAYDPASNTWSPRAPLRTPRGLFAAAAGPDGRIYVMGGFLMGPGSTEDPTGLTSVEVYTPATNSWATIAGMPTGRFELTAATGGDGRIYAMGGRDGFSGPRFSTVEIYQP
jgi:N-acetylneuraminic acid mutarotase